MRLVGAVIRVLPQNNHLDSSKLRQGKGVEHFVLGRINRRSRLPRLPDALPQLREIGLLFFCADGFMPRHKRAVHDGNAK